MFFVPNGVTFSRLKVTGTYLCLHHAASLLANVGDKTIDVHHPLSSYLVHHCIQYDVRSSATHARTGETKKIWRYKVYLLLLLFLKIKQEFNALV